MALTRLKDFPLIDPPVRHIPSTRRRVQSIKRIMALASACLAFATPAFAQSRPEPAVSGGGLLYETHCIGCHSKQIHWRERKLATDWASLAAQVRRWQANTGLQWTNEEVDEVTRYLNRTIYMFPEDGPKRVG